MAAVYQWLAEQNVFQGFAGTLMVAIVVPLTGWFVTRVSASRNMTTFALRIQIPKELQSMPFAVRHVRDGAGAPPVGAQSYKEDKRFPKPRPDQLSTQTLTFPRHVGVLFKVYVDHGDVAFDEVKRHLEDAGYTDVSRDSGPKRSRAWFILPDHAAVKHGNIIDNFYLD
jgi:hypothetical protein